MDAHRLYMAPTMGNDMATGWSSIKSNKEKKIKNATWRWQWALPVTATMPWSFADHDFSESVGSDKHKHMDI